jgi:hypothetical protein
VFERAEEYLERWTTVEGAGPWLPANPHASLELSMGGDLPEPGTIDLRRPDRGVLTIDDGEETYQVDVDHLRVFATDCQCEQPVVIMRRVDTGERLKVCGCGLARREAFDVEGRELGYTYARATSTVHVTQAHRRNDAPPGFVGRRVQVVTPDVARIDAGGVVTLRGEGRGV